MTQTIAEKLVAEHGGKLQAARKILKDCRGDDGRSLTMGAVEKMLHRALKGALLADKPAILEPADADKLNQLKNALDEANIPIDQIGKISLVKVKSGYHEGLTKGPDGEPVVTTLSSKNVEINLSPKWASGPAWPVVQPAKPTVVKYVAPTVIVPRGLRVEMVHPDTQIGYQRVLDSRQFDGRTETCTLLPIHDEQAIDLALQITAAVQPDGFTHVGDIMDFSEFSKYIQVEEFFRTTQSSLDYAHNYLAQVKSAVGAPRKRNGKTVPKKLRLVDGNHDWKRLATYIQLNARAAFGLRPAMSTPESWPDLSLPHLLRLDELGYEQCGMWPGSEAWLIEGRHALVVTHDPKKKGMYQASVIAGHTHHHREETFTVRTPFGHETFTLYEIGCLASLETVKAKGSIQRTRVPSDRGFASNWSQGVAIVEILEDTGQHRVDFVPILDGIAIYQGQKFEARPAESKVA